MIKIQGYYNGQKVDITVEYDADKATAVMVAVLEGLFEKLIANMPKWMQMSKAAQKAIDNELAMDNATKAANKEAT